MVSLAATLNSRDNSSCATRQLNELSSGPTSSSRISASERETALIIVPVLTACYRAICDVLLLKIVVRRYGFARTKGPIDSVVRNSVRVRGSSRQPVFWSRLLELCYRKSVPEIHSGNPPSRIAVPTGPGTRADSGSMRMRLPGSVRGLQTREQAALDQQSPMRHATI